MAARAIGLIPISEPRERRPLAAAVEAARSALIRRRMALRPQLDDHQTALDLGQHAQPASSRSWASAGRAGQHARNGGSGAAAGRRASRSASHPGDSVVWPYDEVDLLTGDEDGGGHMLDEYGAGPSMRIAGSAPSALLTWNLLLLSLVASARRIAAAEAERELLKEAKGLKWALQIGANLLILLVP